MKAEWNEKWEGEWKKQWKGKREREWEWEWKREWNGKGIEMKEMAGRTAFFGFSGQKAQ